MRHLSLPSLVLFATLPLGCGDDKGDTDSGGGGEDCTDPLDWYRDADGDGFGDPEFTPFSSCDQPASSAANADDCDDNDATVFPFAAEDCDGVDDDCDGDVDEEVKSPFYADSDEDGYGDASVVVEDCEAPSGYVASDEDCDDSDGMVSPEALDRVLASVSSTRARRALCRGTAPIRVVNSSSGRVMSRQASRRTKTTVLVRTAQREK